jgi:hypothetical protein
MATNIRGALNEANPNILPSAAQGAQLGNAIAAGGIRRLTSATITANRIALADNDKAIGVVAAYAISGTGTTTVLTPVPIGVAVAAGQVGIAANGDILFNAVDAFTAADVLYVSDDAESEDFTLEVAASVGLLPASKRAWILISGSVITGLIPGAKTPVARGSAPAASQIAIADDGRTIAFNAADVVGGTATVRVLAARATNLNTRLAATTGF